MRKTILYSLLLFSQTAFGQMSWFNRNAEWFYYNPIYQNGNPAYEKLQYVKTKVTGDTLIGGKNCKVLELRFCPGDSLYAHEYVYEHLDSVFYYNYYSNTFHLLYNFNAARGDTIWVHKDSFKPTKGFFNSGYTIDNFGYVVDSVYTQILSDGQEYISQKVSSTVVGKGTWTFFCEEIIKYIGAKCIFLGRYTVFSDDNPGNLKYYKSDTEVRFSNTIDTTCKSVTSTIESRAISNGYIVSYGEESITISFTEKPTRVAAYDLMGREVPFTFTDTGMVINKNRLNSIGFVTCLTRGNILSVIKLLKI